MVAHQSTPFRRFQDVVDAARREPDRWNYATSGAGGFAHISTTLLQQQNNFKLTHVPYRGGGPAVTAAIANEVPLFMTNVVIVSQHIRAGTLRPLGVTTRIESRARTEHAELSRSRASAISRRRPGGPCSGAPAHLSRSSTGCRWRSRRR